MPKISIIVPAYNEEKHIARCLDSILNQTFSDFEVLCIDDGSTDSTFDIIKKYSESDSRIIPLKNTGKGVASARNLGLDNANGEYIGFVDSDDFIQPQTYEFLFKAITDNNADISVCNAKTTSKFIVQTFDYKYEKITLEKLLEKTYLYSIHCVWTKLIRKKIITEYFKNYKIGEDTLFCLHVWLNSKSSILVDLPLYNYYVNENSVTKKNISDKVWIDKTEVSLLSYQLLKNTDIKRSLFLFFIKDGILNLLIYRSQSNDNSKELKVLFKKCFSEYKKCTEISTFKKIYVFISFYFPFLYKLRRKLSNKK